MRIKKTSQYIEGGASLSTVYGTSNSDGYTQSYINSKLWKFEKIGDTKAGAGTLALDKPITDYDLILVITMGGNNNAKTSVLIPVSLATGYNASDDFSGSAIQSPTVYYQTEFYFQNSTTISITGAAYSGWSNAGIKAVYGIKIGE